MKQPSGNGCKPVRLPVGMPFFVIPSHISYWESNLAWNCTAEQDSISPTATAWMLFNSMAYPTPSNLAFWGQNEAVLAGAAELLPVYIVGCWQLFGRLVAVRLPFCGVHSKLLQKRLLFRHRLRSDCPAGRQCFRVFQAAALKMLHRKACFSPVLAVHLEWLPMCHLVKLQSEKPAAPE